MVAVPSSWAGSVIHVFRMRLQMIGIYRVHKCKFLNLTLEFWHFDTEHSTAHRNIFRPRENTVKNEGMAQKYAVLGLADIRMMMCPIPVFSSHFSSCKRRLADCLK